MFIKKILFVSNTSWSLYNFRLGLMKSLKDRGFEVDFCAPYDEYSDKLQKDGFGYFPINLDRKGKNLFKELVSLFSFYKTYKRAKPDLILQYTIKPVIYGSIAAKLNKINFINTITGLGSAFIHENWQTRIIEFLYKIILNSSYRVFFQNKDDLNMFVKKGLIKKEKTILVAGSGVDTEHFNPKFCNSINKRTNNFVFLYVGRMLRDKGVEVLVKAYRKVKEKYLDTELWLLGSIDNGNPTAIPKKEIEGWEDKGLIKYFKFTPDIRSFLCQADCVVLPSFREGMSRTLLEAASMEKPIITTDSIGCKEIVDNGINGYLVPIKDNAILARAMIKMINIGKDKRKKMGEKGREKIIREFDEKIVIEKYIEAIRFLKGPS